MLKIARCTVDWRSIRDLNSGGATNALSHFECDPFDLLGNAPYVNLQKSFPEKGEKSRREQQILSCRKCADFNDNTMENQEEFPKCRLDFECCTIDHSDNSPSMRSTGFPDVFLLHIGTSWNMVEKPVSTRFQRGFGKRKERRKELHEEVLFESSKKLILMQVRKKGAPRGN